MQLVFVCSGNTCRSALALSAWRLAVREIGARGGSKRGAAFGLGRIGATSAGLCASEGAPAAPYAQAIARGWDEDLSDHQAALFRPEHARADLIVTMTRDQSLVVRSHFNLALSQVQLLGDYAPRGAKHAQVARLAPLWEENSHFQALVAGESDSDILDPFGGSLEAYEACAAQIRRCVFELARSVSGL